MKAKTLNSEDCKYNGQESQWRGLLSLEIFNCNCLLHLYKALNNPNKFYGHPL